jgi:phosphatidylglycerol:prolipoprotein diacylglycerol transferase
VRWYGLAYLTAFIVGWLGLRARAKQPWSRIGKEQADDVVFYAALGVILGGRIGYMLIYGHEQLLARPLSIFEIWEGGMSFHGGLVGVLIAMWFYARHIRQPFFVLTDAIAVWVPVGLGLGRVGNFVNGELWGKPTSPDAPWAVLVNGPACQPGTGLQACHASQLYEAFLEGAVLFSVLWWFSRRPRPVMAVSGLFLALYGSFRVLVEFVRIPDEGRYLAFGWLTKGMALSVPMVLAGVALVVLAYKRGQGGELRAPEGHANGSGQNRGRAPDRSS